MILIRRILKKSVVATILLGLSQTGWALTVPNPDPSSLGPDLNGTGLFTPGVSSISVEISDPSTVPLGLSGAEFGFFYATDPSTLISLFDETDQDLGAPGGADLQVVAVNFDTGLIFDADENVFETPFVAQGPNPIGFYLRLTDPIVIAAFGAAPIFTYAILNAGGEDQSGEFPALADPTRLFVSFAGLNQQGQQFTLGTYLVTPLSPSEIPLPAAVWLFGTALIGMFGLSRRKSRR